MNNIAGFIQPTVFPQPSVVGIMPQTMPFMATAGGRSDIITIAIVSAIVVVVMFIIYKNMLYKNIDDEEIEDFTIDNFKNNLITEPEMDPLTRNGWEVRVSPSCPYCIKQKEILSQYFPTFKNIFTDRPANVVPTWVNSRTGKEVPGMLQYEDLLQLTNEDNISGSGVDPLTKCGWEVRVSPTCPYCIEQKRILSHHFPTFKNIFTDRPAEVVPTWINSRTGEKVLGMKRYHDLLVMAKC